MLRARALSERAMLLDLCPDSSREQLTTCSGRSVVFTNTVRARGVERGCGGDTRQCAVIFDASVPTRDGPSDESTCSMCLGRCDSAEACIGSATRT